MTTLVDVLQRHVAQTPDRIAYRFCPAGQQATVTLTYAQLDQQARQLADWLIRAGMSGTPVLLLLPSCMEYVTGLIGCFYAGCIAVPAYSPHHARQLDRIDAIINSSGARVGLVLSRTLPKVEADASHIKWLAMDDEATWRGMDPQWNGPLRTNELAILQYTSGSTNLPKGVAVSHANMVHNLGHMAAIYGCHESSVCVTWLPIFHDMGLIAGMFLPLYAGFPCVFMSPAGFIQQPLRWLELISTFRGTFTASPNFGYEYCVEKISPARCAGLDLSCWDVAMNAAETVRADVMQRFSERFGAVGFRHRSFMPAYGLAEATLIVTTGRAKPPQARESSQASVSCGVGFADQTVLVVDPNTRISCAPGLEGEIWVTGPSLAQGYWRQPAVTEDVFNARLAEPCDNATTHQRFLRTGDLGYLLDGELYVSGRIKDVVNIAGVKYHPTDIEATSKESHPAVRGGTCAVFGIEENGRENLVVVQEAAKRYRGDAREALKCIVEQIAQVHQIVPHRVLIVNPGDVPRTSSGKVQRSECKRLYASGAFVPLAEVQRPSIDLDALLSGIWSEVLNAQDVGMQDNFFDLGGNSIAAMQIAARLQEALGIDLPIEAFFEAPTLTALKERLEYLRSAADITLPSLVPQHRAQDLPLSFAQERLWFLEQLGIVGQAYHESLAVRLRGQIDADVLRRSFECLMHRHESLRTRFVEINGLGRQIIDPPSAEFALECLDLSHVNDAEPSMRGHIHEFAARPFHLATDTLLRALLIRLPAQEHVLVIATHHIVFDGWSTGIALQELAEIYGAYERKLEPQLPQLPIQYADYAVWQREWLQGEHLERQMVYWREQLAGIPTLLNLPTDRPRPVVASYRGNAVPIRVPRDVLSKLQELSQREGATLYMTVLSVLQLLLSRYSGQKDVVVGSPIAARRYRQLEGVIGFLVNTLVLRTQVDEQETFLALLQRVKATTLAAYAHQDVPFEKLVHELQPERDLSRAPLFQVFFVLQKAAIPRQLGGWEVETVPRQVQTAKFDLLLDLTEVEGELRGQLEYATDLFDLATIESMQQSFNRLLSCIAADTNVPLRQLSLLDDEQHHRVLTQWSAGPAQRHVEGCVHELFESQAARMPDALAVSDGERTFTYGELNARANRFARRLRELGVRPDTTVAVYADHSVDVAVALLGILKAGGTYVPLDPTNPPRRLLQVVRNSRPKVIVVRPGTLDSSLEAELAAIPQIDFTIDKHSSALDSDANLSREFVGVYPDHLAYVIYTSGSTGTPKGVAMPHRALTNLFTWQNEHGFAIARQRTLQYAALSFDVSLQEICGALCAGSMLVFIEGGARRDFERLNDLIMRERIERLHLPYVALQALAESESNTAQTGSIHKQSALTDIVAAGEQLRVTPSISRFVARHAQCTLHNHYGPSETHVVTALSLRGSPCSWPMLPSIGRPISNVQAYIVDQYGNAVPPRVTGELWIGGPCLARGYMNRGGSTAASFVANPFDTAAGSRLYRTGDMARWNHDGSIEFLGRKDRQVKFQGYRIEPGEIEVQLMRLSGVRESVVVVDNTGKAQELIAYLVADSSISVDGIRAQLLRVLPSHMVPARFSLLEAMPLTSSGKVDQAALPQLVDLPQPAREIEPPANDIEQSIAACWTEVLGIAVGRHDNFFKLGGDSIKSVQVAAGVRQRGLDFKIAQLFATPTLAELARVTERMKISPKVDDPASCGEPGGNHQFTAPLSAMQTAMLFQSKLETGKGIYHQVGFYKIVAAFDTKRFQAALTALVDSHAILRTRYDLSNLAGPLQIEHDDAAIAFRITAADSELQALRVIQSWTEREYTQDFEDGAWPWLRMQVVVCGVDVFYLGLSFHHALLDGWSEGRLVDELIARYVGLPVSIEPSQNTAVLRDFLKTEREAINSDLQKQAWLTELQPSRTTEVSTLLQLERQPAWKISEDATCYWGTWQISDATAAAIKRHSTRLNVTPKSVWLAIHLKVLSTACGQRRVTTGVTSHARPPLPGATDALGMFLNILPFVVGVGTQSWDELIREVFELEGRLDAIKTYPYSSMVQTLGTAPVGTLFNYVRKLERESGQPAVIEQCRPALGSSEFPVSVSVQAADEQPVSFVVRVAVRKRQYQPFTVAALLTLYETAVRQMEDGG